MTKSLTSIGNMKHTQHICVALTQRVGFSDICIYSKLFPGGRLSIYFKFDAEQAKLEKRAGNKGLVCW
jgi:hypothetical protein